jgi:hypothetical protein
MRYIDILIESAYNQSRPDNTLAVANHRQQPGMPARFTEKVAGLKRIGRSLNFRSRIIQGMNRFLLCPLPKKPERHQAD